MKVKICGITDLQTAKAAIEFGADAIGFVFAESKRKISSEHAADIISHLPANVWKVGVFVNETTENIEKIAVNTGLTHIQVHGDETNEYCELLTLPVIKAISIHDHESVEKAAGYSSPFILVDGPKGKYHGGNGLSFDWTLLKGTEIKDKNIILAGGLTQENVKEAILLTNPYMVDVSSGVETEGKKDLEKIKSFIEKAKGSQMGGTKNEFLYIAE